SLDRRKLSVNVGADVYAPLLIALPNVKSNQFKITFSNEDPRNDTNFNEKWMLNEIIISEASGLDNYANKSLVKMHPTPLPAWDSYIWEIQDTIANQSNKVKLNDVIDISDNMD